MKDSNATRWQEIARLLLVLFAAVGAAVACVALCLYVYCSSGQYLAGALLLDPTRMEPLMRVRNAAHLTMEYQHGVGAVPVSLAAYQNFYTSVAWKKSLADAQEAKLLFSERSVDVLLVSFSYFSQDRNQRTATELKQRVEFSGDFFRVALSGFGPEQWAYFRAPRSQRLLQGGLAS